MSTWSRVTTAPDPTPGDTGAEESTPDHTRVPAPTRTTPRVEWTPLGSIKGPPGPAGPQGPAGDVNDPPDLLDLTLVFENGLL